MRLLIGLMLAAFMHISGCAASTFHIDLMALGGTPGPFFLIHGPCYCSGGGFESNIYSGSPGDIFDFGQVVLQPFVSGPTPDAGEDQQVLIEQGYTAVSYNPLQNIPYPQYSASFCDQVDSACLLAALQPPAAASLEFTIPTGFNEIQVAWGAIGFSYTPPTILSSAVPEPPTWIMLLIGLACAGYFYSPKPRALQE